MYFDAVNSLNFIEEKKPDHSQYYILNQLVRESVSQFYPVLEIIFSSYLYLSVCMSFLSYTSRFGINTLSLYQLFLNGNRNKPAKQKKNSSCKFIEVTNLRRSGRGCGSRVIIISLKLVFFKIPDLVHRCTLAPVVSGNRC